VAARIYVGLSMAGQSPKWPQSNSETCECGTWSVRRESELHASSYCGRNPSPRHAMVGCVTPAFSSR